MVNKSILDNGIRVISEHIPHAHSVTIGIWVASGSRDERPEINGVAHFIEHLLFKGTGRRDALQIAREIDALGGVLNAFTGREYVCFYAKVLHRFLPKVADLLADIFLDSLFDPDEIEKERKVILQEIGLLEDSPDDHIHDLFARKFWEGHPLGRPIIGTEESVAGLTRDLVVDYRDGVYRGGDIIVAAAGHVDHNELLALFQGVLNRIPPGKRGGAARPDLPTRKVEVVAKELEQVHLCLGTLGLPHGHPLRYEAFILNAVLGGSMSSRLFQEVREKLGLAYSIYSYLTAHSDSGSIAIYAGTSRERHREVIDIVLRELRRLRTDPFSREELENAKEQLKGNILLSLESSDNRMTKLAKNEIYFGRYQPLMEIVKGIDRVTPESILSLAADIVDDNYLTVVLMGELAGAAVTPADIGL